MTIGKISLGVNSQKNFHDFKHDVNSTLGFGFCEPTLIHSMHAKSSISLQTKSVVRLAPLPCPTFGRIKARQDTIFVPMCDVFEAWNEFISGTGYTTANGSGVPTKVDHMTFNQFFILMNTMNYLGSYTADTFKLENINNLFSQMFTYSISMNWSPFWSGDDLANGRLDMSWRDLDALVLSASTPDGKGNALRFYQEMLIHLFGAADLDFHTKLGTTENNTFAEKVFDSAPNNEIFNNWEKIAHSFFKPSYFKNATMPDTQTLVNLSKAFNSAPEVVKSLFDMPRTHQNADFCYVFSPQYCLHFDDLQSFDSGEDDTITGYQQGGSYKICLNFHLTPYGKRVMKILNAMGVGSRYDDTIELPKLFAYYKAWFDLYDPQRTKNWKQTTCYKLVHNYYDYRHTMTDYLEGVESYPSGDLFTDLSSFLIDLVKCNYYLGADTFTVAQRYPLQPASGNLNNPQMLNGLSPILYQGKYFGQSDMMSVPSGTNGFGMVNQNTSNFNLTSLSVVALERLYYAINKESALASNIEDIMLSRFGVNIKSTRVLNRSDYDIEIDPVFGTVNNDKTMLGEYAGKAIASGSTKCIDFEAPEQGYLIQLFSVVPYGGYNQGSTPAQIKRGDFYSDFIAMYDSLGYEKMTKGQILGKESIINNFSQAEEFGSVPQLFHLKYRQNLANGGFAFRSERAGFHPYFLDRIFSEGDINENVNGNVDENSNAFSKPIDIVPDTVLRTIGLYEGFGNYDRIFYDTTGLSDNFILHMIQDLKYYSPMKPIGQSFDTFDKNVDDNSRNVEHA